MDTLRVCPSALEELADRLDRLAWTLRFTADHLTELDGCLALLDQSWSGRAARAARARLVDLRQRLFDLLDLPERDRANRAVLARHPELDWLRHRLDGPGIYLLDLDTAGDGRLIVAFGDPVHSDNLATFVPGARATLADSGDELERAWALREAAGGSTSVVMWLGYDAPDGLDAALPAAAAAAVPQLRHFQRQLVAQHDGPIHQLTLIGHSYGSFVIGLADRGPGVPADDLVALASPGMGVNHAGQLRDPDQVWASSAPNDAIRLVPGLVLGRDPVDPRFGAHVFASSPGDDPLDAHSGYFEPGNPGLRTLARIVTTGRA